MPEDPDVGKTESLSRPGQILIKTLKCPPGSPVHQRKCHQHRRRDSPVPVHDKSDAELQQELSERAPGSKEKQQKIAADRRRQHHRQRQDHVQDPFQHPRQLRGVISGKNPAEKNNHTADGRNPQRIKKREPVHFALTPSVRLPFASIAFFHFHSACPNLCFRTTNSRRLFFFTIFPLFWKRRMFLHSVPYSKPRTYFTRRLYSLGGLAYSADCSYIICRRNQASEVSGKQELVSPAKKQGDSRPGSFQKPRQNPPCPHQRMNNDLRACSFLCAAFILCTPPEFCAQPLFLPASAAPSSRSFPRGRPHTGQYRKY